MSCLTHHENKLYSGSFDKTIRIWNTENYEPIATLENTSWVMCLTVHGNKLYSGNEDKTYSKFEDLNYNNDIQSFSWSIITTIMNNIIEERNQLCICLARIAKERDIKNKEKREQGEKTQVKLDIFTMPNHIKKMFGEFLKTPKYTELVTLRGHTLHVTYLTLHENKLYSGGYNKTIRIWNTETYEEIATLRGHTNWVRCIAAFGNKLYSGWWVQW